MSKNKLKYCWIKGIDLCVNQTNDVRKCIQCKELKNKYKKNS